MSEHAAEYDALGWCAQADWPVVPCLRICVERTPHHHHNQEGTRWTNPCATCPGPRPIPPAETAAAREGEGR